MAAMAALCSVHVVASSCPCASSSKPNRGSVVNFARIGSLRTNTAASSKFVPRVLSASAVHTSGGSVDRNDAAPSGPLSRPHPRILLEEAVKLQMEALSCNDKPRFDHGLEVMYYFADTEGTHNGGSLPIYFGFPSDLYHFGHFVLKFKTRYPELIDHLGFKLLQHEESKEADEVRVYLTAKGRGNGESSTWIFTMSRRSRGQQAPCWLTKSLLKYANNH